MTVRVCTPPVELVTFDIAGTNVGCRCVIGVGHGTHARAELESHPHTHLLVDLTTLAEVLCG